ncbi:MAG: site-specific integrase [Deltaproteobacteria bacterium]|jgi:integrase|nr:site-specific integrase [Deltaproteobacteria bacterium]
MSNITSRKYIKTKFEGVFYRTSAKRDPRTGEADRVYCFWYADHEGKGHWKTVGRHSQGVRPQAARRTRAKFLAELAAGVNPAQQEKITVGQAVDAYASWAKSEDKAIAHHLCQYNMHLRARMHTFPIADVTPGMLSAIKAELMKTRIVKKKEGDETRPPRLLAGQTVNNILSFVRASINRAIGTGMWNGANPLSTKRGGPWQLLKVNNARLRFLTPKEAKDLLTELKTHNPQLHDMALLSLRTGLRATEIFKLKGQDVDAHADVLYIIAKGGSRVALRIPSDIAAMLRAYKRSSGEPLFKTPATGTAFKKTPIGFNRAVKRLKLAPEDGNSLYAVTFHTLRHTFASWLAQSGKVTLIELKNLMRHKNINMTLRYAHLIPGQESEKLSIVSGLLA